MSKEKSSRLTALVTVEAGSLLVACLRLSSIWESIVPFACPFACPFVCVSMRRSEREGERFALFFLDLLRFICNCESSATSEFRSDASISESPSSSLPLSELVEMLRSSCCRSKLLNSMAGTGTCTCSGSRSVCAWIYVRFRDCVEERRLW